jgi:hypothetical protein
MSTDPELHALIDQADELLVRCERSLMRVEDKRREVELLEGVFGGIDFLRPQPSLLVPEEVEEYRTAVTAVLGQLRTAHAAVPELVTSVEAARHLLGRARLGGARAKTRAHVIRLQPVPQLGFARRDPLEVIRALAVLGDIADAAPELDALPPLGDLDPERCYLAWTITLVSTRPADELQRALDAIAPGALALGSERELRP